MLAGPPMRQPVRVTELLGIPKSCEKKSYSDKKRLEPVRVKDLLASCSKKTPCSGDSVSKKTFTNSRSAKKPVRRALYSKLGTPGQSPNRKSTKVAQPVTVVAKKSLNLPRKSLLAPPNSIAQKHVRQIINANARPSIIIEERPSDIHTSLILQHQRATVIKSMKSRRSQTKNDDDMNKSVTIPTIVVPEDEAKNENNELEALTADKENIPPPFHQTIQPLTVNVAKQFENDCVDLESLYRAALIEIEELKHDVKTLKTVQATQTNLLQKIYDLIVNKFEPPAITASVTDTSSIPQILNDHKSPLNVRQLDKENVISEKKKRRESKEIIPQRRRSARLAAKFFDEKNDSFRALEDELNICNKLMPKQSPVIKTPKNNEPRSGGKTGDRPLREYLKLKSSLHYLETPEPNGFRRNVDLIKIDTPFRSKSLERSISHKLFDELQDLYLDSPNSESSSQ